MNKSTECVLLGLREEQYVVEISGWGLVGGREWIVKTTALISTYIYLEMLN